MQHLTRQTSNESQPNSYLSNNFLIPHKPLAPIPAITSNCLVCVSRLCVREVFWAPWPLPKEQGKESTVAISVCANPRILCVVRKLTKKLNSFMHCQRSLHGGICWELSWTGTSMREDPQFSSANPCSVTTLFFNMRSHIFWER